MRARPMLFLKLLLVLLALPACSRDPGLFSDQNARAHIAVLAETIGSRSVGTAANARARTYVVDQLKQAGFEVRLQETDARRRELGRTARVSNIIAVLPGTRSEAIGLLSHYDSAPDAPGASDDGFGVAVSLEAARVVAARRDRTWSTFVLMTDGEEAGLMGAAALMTDPEVSKRLQAYINIESIGSSGTAVLFETGPANAWLVAPWARRAPHPRGGSYAIEIYRRLPNDTDFSILQAHGIPGLNFAAVDDSYAYHTPRDTADRLSTAALRTTGENVVTIVNALQQTDITQRSTAAPTFFDIGRTVGVSYGPVASWLAGAVALALGVLAWVRVAAQAIRTSGLGRWVLTAIWALLGAAAVVAAMVALTWLLRAAREVYHPWYARPGRLFVLLMAGGIAVGWSMGRLGRWLPSRAHAPRHPAVVWSLALPVWIVLASAALWVGPAAAYLWVVPLLGAAILLSSLPPANDAALRVASLLIFAAAATLWLRESYEFLRFLVAVMGRLPIVTPVFVYAAVISAAALMIVPPLLAAITAPRPLVRPSIVTAFLLLLTAASAGFAYMAPAYTYHEPLRRHVRALQDAGSASAIWEVASIEPGLDLEAGAPRTWAPAADSVRASIPWGRLRYPFVFRATGPALGNPPASISGWSAVPLASGTELTVNVVASEPGVAVSFVLPEGLTPARSNLPGVERLGRWTATYVAPPPEGVAWRASFGGIAPPRLDDVRVAATMGRLSIGPGFQGLPAWLPQDRAVWSVGATWVLTPPRNGEVALQPTLR